MADNKTRVDLGGVDAYAAAQAAGYAGTREQFAADLAKQGELAAQVREDRTASETAAGQAAASAGQAAASAEEIKGKSEQIDKVSGEVSDLKSDLIQFSNKIGVVYNNSFSQASSGIVVEIPISKSGNYRVELTKNNGYKDVYFYEMLADGGYKELDRKKTNDGFIGNGTVNAGSKIRVYVSELNQTNATCEITLYSTYNTILDAIKEDINNREMNMYHPTKIIYEGSTLEKEIFFRYYIDGLTNGKTFFINTETDDSIYFIVCFLKGVSPTGMQQTEVRNKYATITLADDYDGIAIYSVNAMTNMHVRVGFCYENMLTEEIEALNKKVSEISSKKHTISILGDSWSTYKGYTNPETNAQWYPSNTSGTEGHDNDVKFPSQTWWHLVCKENGLILDTNNSYSGSPICYDGYGEGTADAKSYSFVSRMKNIGTPDIIFIQGGTNDSSVGVNVGMPKYSDWLEGDFINYSPSLCYIIDFYSMRHPNAKIYFLMNNSVNVDIKNATQAICEHYGVDYVLLDNVDFQGSHPSISGMRRIADIVNSYIRT